MATFNNSLTRQTNGSANPSSVMTAFPPGGERNTTTLQPAAPTFQPQSHGFVNTNTGSTPAHGETTDFLHIKAARPGQVFREPRINELSITAVKGMSNGHQVFVYVADVDPEVGGQLLTIKTIPLMALAVLSPIVNVALRTYNKKTNGHQINHVVLPPGPIRAYREIVNWVWDVVINGKMVPLRTLNGKALVTYAEITKICNQLKITWLAVGLKRRTFDALKVDGRRQFTVHPGDVREAMGLDADHWLRGNMVEAIAKAELTSSMHPSFATKYQDLCGELPCLREEVEAMEWHLSMQLRAVPNLGQGLPDLISRVTLHG